MYSTGLYEAVFGTDSRGVFIQEVNLTNRKDGRSWIRLPVRRFG